MKNFICAVILVFTILFASSIFYSCDSLKSVENIFSAMDTVAQTKVVAKDKKLCEDINAEIESMCKTIDTQLSKTIETSDIYRLNNEGAGIDISDGTISVLKTAKYIKEITGGAYEPALGEIVDLWNINEGIGKLPQKDELYTALEKIKDYTVEEIDGKEQIAYVNGERLAFDLGGIGKGYAADKINAYLKKKGRQVSGVLVSFGSSILASGKTHKDELWSIGVKNPLNPENICGVIGASNKFISVSGGYERYIEIDGITYCHIIDPETGYPVNNDLLCTIVVIDSKNSENNGAISDALSTALYVMGKQGALDFYAKGLIDFEMILFVKADNEKGYDILCTNVIFEEIE